MLTEKKRKAQLFMAAFFMNLVFFLIANLLRLPVWLDTTGTIYISIILGFPSGFLIGILNNTILSLWFYEFNSIFYYLISIAVALTSDLCLKKAKKIDLKFMAFLMISLFFVSILFAIPLTIILDNGIPSDYWGKYLYDLFANMGYGSLLATALSVSIIKSFDVIATVSIVYVAYILTPEKLKNSSNVIKLIYHERKGEIR